MSNTKELDRFKRQLIRKVAALRQQKVTDVWAEVEKTMGMDCRPLWQRMRVLTLKKLSRLLAVNDMPAKLAPVARMTITDWLMLDLVLVHENIDVIEDVSRTEAYNTLMSLLKLVQKFNLERCPRDQLPDNWASATLHYNQKGRQCSPMLLQRRWYEMKALTRESFYKYWAFGYQKQDHKRRHRPQELCIMVAKEYNHTITEFLPSWAEMMRKNLIVLPSEFEEILRKNSEVPAPSTSTEPDLVLIEPIIETIELDLEDELEEEAANSQDESSNDSEPESVELDTPVLDMQKPGTSNVVIKTEKLDPEVEELDGLSNVQILGTTHIDEGNKDATHFENNQNILVEIENHPTLLGKNEIETPVILKVETVSEELMQESIKNTHINEGSKDATNFENNQNSSVETDFTPLGKEEIETPVILKVETVSEELMQEPLKKIKASDLGRDEIIMIDNESDNEADKNFEQEQITERPGPKCKKDLFSTTKKSTRPLQRIETLSNMINRPGPRCQKNSEYLKNNDNNGSRKITELEVTDIENISQVPESQENMEEPSKIAINQEPKLDIDEFIDCDMDFVDDTLDEEAVLIDDATLKSLEQQHNSITLPGQKNYESSCSSSTVKTEETEEDKVEGSSTPKFDLKLLMIPVVYTLKLDQMELLKNRDINVTIFDPHVLDSIEALSKAMSNKNAELNVNSEGLGFSDTDSDDYDEDNYANRSYDMEECKENIFKQPLNENSYLFQKPKNRIYTPIQLCKNPDFNTPLRRLSVAFLTKSRNRQLLKICKPLTVDLHKVFEDKLVDGIIYLQSNNQVGELSNPAIFKDNIDSQSTSVLPSAMPVQSLVDKETVDIQTLLHSKDIINTSLNVWDITHAVENKLLMSRKNKVILPDIDKIRQVNSHLLTAQVPPLQVCTEQFLEEQTPSDIVRKEAEINTTQTNISQPQIHETKLKIESSYEEQPLGSLDPKENETVETKITGAINQQELKVIPKTKVTDSSVQKELKKNILKEKINKPWYASNSIKSNQIPWYKRPYTQKQDIALLKEDSLHRMLKELIPEANTPQPKPIPLHKRSYCCLAKRHTILNEARSRLYVKTTNKKRQRRFRNELYIHTCPTFDSCTCCCKHLIPWRKPIKVVETDNQLELETQEIAEQLEINKAIAGIDSINEESPTKQRGPTVTMGLPLPPLVKIAPKPVKIAPKPVKIAPKPVKTTIKNKAIEILNNKSELPIKKDLNLPTEKHVNIINDSCENVSVHITNQTCENLSEINKAIAQIESTNEESVTNVVGPAVTIAPPMPPLVIMPSKPVNIENDIIDLSDDDEFLSEVKQMSKMPTVPSKPRVSRSRKRTLASNLPIPKRSRICETKHKNEKKSQDPLLDTYTRVDPETWFKQDNINTMDTNAIEILPKESVEFPPGSKISLLNNGEVVQATHQDGTVFRLTSGQQQVLREMVFSSPTHRASTIGHIVEINDTGVLNPLESVHPIQHIPLCVLNEDGIPVMISNDSIVNLNQLMQLSNNQNSVMNEIVVDNNSGGIMLVQNHQKLGLPVEQEVISTDQIVTDENVREVILLKNPERKERPKENVELKVIPITNGKESMDNKDITNTNTNEEIRKCIQKGECSEEVKQDIIDTDSTEKSADSKNLSQMSSDNPTNELGEEHAQIIESNKKICEIAIAKSNDHNNGSSSNAFIKVKHFAKIHEPSENYMTTKSVEEATLSKPAKTSILSDLMEISGISIDDDNIVEPNVEISTPISQPVHTVQELTITEPHIINKDLADVSKAGKVYMFDSKTGEFTEIALAPDQTLIKQTLERKATVKRPIKHRTRISKKNDSIITMSPNVIELDDSDGDDQIQMGEGCAKEKSPSKSANIDVATKQLLQLLSDKKNKSSFNLRDPRSILRKQHVLKQLIEDNVRSCSQAISRVKQKRKEKIETKIDLVDSDAPMEEEYLVDSADSDCDIHSPVIRKRQQGVLDSEDSSDDEPLAVIVKRKKSNKTLKNKSPFLKTAPKSGDNIAAPYIYLEVPITSKQEAEALDKSRLNLIHENEIIDTNYHTQTANKVSAEPSIILSSLLNTDISMKASSDNTNEFCRTDKSPHDDKPSSESKSHDLSGPNNSQSDSISSTDSVMVEKNSNVIDSDDEPILKKEKRKKPENSNSINLLSGSKSCTKMLSMERSIIEQTRKTRDTIEVVSHSLEFSQEPNLQRQKKNKETLVSSLEKECNDLLGNVIAEGSSHACVSNHGKSVDCLNVSLITGPNAGNENCDKANICNINASLGDNDNISDADSILSTGELLHDASDNESQDNDCILGI